jgi:hypothetical protein
VAVVHVRAEQRVRRGQAPAQPRLTFRVVVAADVAAGVRPPVRLAHLRLARPVQPVQPVRPAADAQAGAAVAFPAAAVVVAR